MTGKADAVRDEPLVVRATVRETDVRQGVETDHFHEQYRHIDDEHEADDVVASIEALDEPVREAFVDLVLGHDLAYRTPFSHYLTLDTEEWVDAFGESPSRLDDWAPVWEAHRWAYETDYGMFEEEKAEEAPGMHDIRNGDKHVLAVDCTYAVELSRVGFLSLKQAQAYLLREFGYKTGRIAEMMGVERGTASSHVSRGKRKVARMRQGSGLVDYVDDETPTFWGVLEERVGDAYRDAANDQYVRVLGLENWSCPVYIVEYEDGEKIDVMPSRVRDWEPVDEQEAPV